MLQHLSNADIEMLASFERPPRGVERVMLAVFELLGIPNHSWTHMRRMLSVDLHNDESDDEQTKHKTRAHEQFQAALDETSSYRTWRRPDEKAVGYPEPAKTQYVSRLVSNVLTYTGQGRDPRQVLKMLRKYVNDPEFTPENAKQFGKAAHVLCVWVHAVNLHFREIKRKPGRAQIEKAIGNGAAHLRFPSNTRISVS
jgi:hypothetical protein